MTEEAALLRAVCADPHNDTPRLIYADWCEEQGDPRGEFIRLQCRLRYNKEPECWADPQCEECDGDGQVGPCGLTDYYRKCFACSALKKRIQELLEENGRSWGRPFLQALGLSDEYISMYGLCNEIGWFYERGFVNHLNLHKSSRWWGEHCPSCDGLGVRLDDPFDASVLPDCRTCRGQGRVDQCGPLLVRLAPLTSVRLLDRMPIHLTDQRSVHWIDPGHERARSHSHAVVPDCLFQVWPKLRSPFTHELAAHEQLSCACLEWAGKVQPHEISVGRMGQQ